MILRITVRWATAPPFLPTFSAARARKPVPNGLRRRDLGPDRHCATAAQPAAAPFTPPPVRRQSSPRQHRTERALTAQHELPSRQDRANSWTSVDHILTPRTPRRRLALVPAEVGLAVGDYEQMPQLRLADRVGPGEVEWPDLGYADACLDSWAVFSRLREDRVIPAGGRFQFEYPTPTARSPSWSLISRRRCWSPTQRPDASDGTRDWGIRTECGMGRAERAGIAALLDMHREASAAAELARPSSPRGSRGSAGKQGHHESDHRSIACW